MRFGCVDRCRVCMYDRSEYGIGSNYGMYEYICMYVCHLCIIYIGTSSHTAGVFRGRCVLSRRFAPLMVEVVDRYILYKLSIVC